MVTLGRANQDGASERDGASEQMAGRDYIKRSERWTGSGLAPGQAPGEPLQHSHCFGLLERQQLFSTLASKDNLIRARRVLALTGLLVCFYQGRFSPPLIAERNAER